ncbi:MAG: SusC/RagA family TonB-linked outer membrane protein [Bacteroidales bacterium]
MKRIIFFSLFLALSYTVALAQAGVSGTVTSAEDNAPLPGVSVLVQGTQIGTITDVDGFYTIEVPGDDAVLIFSFVGMDRREEAVKGRSTIDVELASEYLNLDEVVVTAVGITRTEKSLGYKVSTVGDEQLNSVRESSVVNSLSGKVSGVRINQQSGTVGGSSKIIIRGANSLGGDNQPIFVVDGMPIDNSYYEPNEIEGNVDVGNRATDLSSDDVQSISVLKGSAATALYGARAKNGAIIITTKRGKAGTMQVQLNSSYRWDTPLKLPEFQNEYAQGSYGNYDLKFLNGWGPEISQVQDQLFTDFKGDEVTLQAYPNNVRDFYQTGLTMINSIGISGGDENSDFRLGVTNNSQQGVIPESYYGKNSISLNAGRKLSDRLSARASINYIKTNSTGRPAQGSNDKNILSSKINGLPRTVSIEDVKNNYVDEFGKQISLDGDKSVNNPYWIINNNKFTNDLERMIGSMHVSYKLTDWLTISNRVGTDFYAEYRRQVYKKGTLGHMNGKFTTWNLFNRVFNNDAMATMNFDLNSDLNVRVIAGHNIYQAEWRRTTVTATDLVLDDLYTFGNAKSTSPSNLYNIRRLMGVYADVGLSYKNFLYMNITGRNDWSSTLPVSNNAYFYPSVSSSLIFTELLPKNDVLSFGKIRLSWANVGSDEDPYQLDFQFTAAEEYYAQFSLNGNFPHGGLVGVTGPRVYPTADLQPQNASTVEVGTDLRLFNNRIGIDFTYYNTMTTNQIIAIDIPLSTGYFNKNVNVGAVSNVGFEADLHLAIVRKTGGVNWNVDVNFNKNTQIVEELSEGLSEYQLTSGWSGLQIKATPGEEFGLYGTGWKRNEAGEIIINPNTGLREIAPGKRFGDIYPDWIMGINNTFSFKGIDLNFLVDIRQGGVFYSGTVGGVRSSGLAIETLENRGQSFIDHGVLDQGDGTYVPNDVPVQSMQDFWSHYSAISNTEGNVFDASYIKLREIRLSYNLPGGMLERTFIEGLRLGVEARNLWIIRDLVPHVDPELNFFGPAAVGEGVEFNSIPSVRSYGVNLMLTF